MDEVKINFELDTRYESYRGLFKDDWAKRAFEFSKNSKKLEELILGLTARWRGAIYTAEFPALMIDQFAIFIKGYMSHQAPNSALLKAAAAIKCVFANNIDEVSADPALQRKLVEHMVKLNVDLPEVPENTFEVSQEKLWKEYFSIPVYQITLWHSVTISFVAIYNAYDHFVLRSYLAASGEASAQTGRGFSEKFRNIFGNELLEKCWNSSELNRIKKIRHSLSHAGGHVTDDLKKIKHGIRVCDDVLQIWPGDIHHAFQQLKDAAILLIEYMHTLPAFHDFDLRQKNTSAETSAEVSN